MVSVKKVIVPDQMTPPVLTGSSARTSNALHVAMANVVKVSFVSKVPVKKVSAKTTALVQMAKPVSTSNVLTAKKTNSVTAARSVSAASARSVTAKTTALAKTGRSAKTTNVLTVQSTRTVKKDRSVTTAQNAVELAVSTIQTAPTTKNVIPTRKFVKVVSTARTAPPDNSVKRASA